MWLEQLPMSLCESHVEDRHRLKPQFYVGWLLPIDYFPCSRPSLWVFLQLPVTPIIHESKPSIAFRSLWHRMHSQGILVFNVGLWPYDARYFLALFSLFLWLPECLLKSLVFVVLVLHLICFALIWRYEVIPASIMHQKVWALDNAPPILQNGMWCDDRP